MKKSEILQTLPLKQPMSEEEATLLTKALLNKTFEVVVKILDIIV